VNPRKSNVAGLPSPCDAFDRAQTVMQIDTRQQGRYHGSLRSALCRGYSASVLNHARFEPFADQTQNPLIGDPVFQKPKHPAVIDFIEKRPNVGVQNPVHLLALDSDRERVVLSVPSRNPYENRRKSSS
jgi:hypothetical protein